MKSEIFASFVAGLLVLIPLANAWGQSCSPDAQASFESQLQNATQRCSSLSEQSSAAQGRYHQAVRERAGHFKVAVRTFGRACVEGLLRTKRSSGCKGGRAKRASSIVRVIRALDADIRATSSRLKQANRDASSACAAQDSAAAKLATYLDNCPPANPNPPPNELFRPDYAVGAFSPISGSEQELPSRSWLKAQWSYLDYFGNAFYTFNFRTNGKFDGIFIYDCPSCIWITRVEARTLGSYTFDGTTLRVTGATKATYATVNGQTQTATTAISSEMNASIVVLEEQVGFSAARAKLGIKLEGSSLFINQSSPSIYYLELLQ